MTETNQQSNLPQHIGLALSGGGYRAAGFHLGLLSYLNHVDLLKQVKMISTVSGGTFTGAKYTLSLVSGQSFQEFYQEYYNFLKNTKLIELTLNNLSKKQSKTPSLRNDLITATAQAYAETFLQDANGKPYLFGDILNANIPLKEVIFNATEFRTGLAFRFQCSANSKAKIGNGNISIDKSDAADIRIADIVAASSCFPGGFEPLAFPGDFNWSDSNILNNVRSIVHEKQPEDGEGLAPPAPYPLPLCLFGEGKPDHKAGVIISSCLLENWYNRLIPLYLLCVLFVFAVRYKRVKGLCKRIWYYLLYQAVRHCCI